MASSHLALEVVIRHEGHTLARCLLRRGRYVIGQDRKNEIVANADSVSGKHARLTVASDDHFLIEDLQSANGTFVNGAAIHAPAPLTLDSSVNLGDVTLTFERGGLPAAVFPHLPEGFLRGSRYQIGAAIVEGRTSIIYEARDTVLRRSVALRVLRCESQADTRQVLAFIREAQITAQLAHANILPIYDFGLDEEIGLFCTTRFIEGESLGSLLDEMASGGQGAPRATFSALLQIFLKSCSAVAFAHSRGVTHTTLAPETIVFGRFGEVFVDHWGLARPGLPLDGSTTLVEAPLLAGRPPISRYTAPEQTTETDDADPRTDVHALGAILFRILTLRNYNPGHTAEEVLAYAQRPSDSPAAALGAYPPPAHIPGGHWPERLANACVRALSPAREERFASAQELKKEINDWLENLVAANEPAKMWKQFTSFLGRH